MRNYLFKYPWRVQRKTDNGRCIGTIIDFGKVGRVTLQLSTPRWRDKARRERERQTESDRQTEIEREREIERE